MAKDVKFYELWTAKEIFGSIGAVVLIFLIFWFLIFYTPIIYENRLSKYNANTQGELIDYKKVTRVSQSKYGNEIIVDHYDVTYKYEVKDMEYTSTCEIPSEGLFGHKLKKINSSENKKIVVRYKKEDPSKSMVDLMD